MNLFLYGHGGSGNHGCEAIVRTTQAMLKGYFPNPILASIAITEDQKYGLPLICNLAEEKSIPRKASFSFLAAYLKLRLCHDYLPMDKLRLAGKAVKSAKRGDIALSIGGDNFCYKGAERFVMLNQLYRKHGAKTVLWGCSVEPEVLENKMLRDDLASYDLITARESLTYDLLKAVNPNTVLVSDPAFTLKKMELSLPQEFLVGNTVGINMSPMIIENETHKGIALKNYITLISFILEKTDMAVCLIPHVVWETTDDREPLKLLYDQFAHTGRICMIEDCNCMQLKGYIARCRFFIGARTHATIAAYSTCVPTIVVGYSIKARGISKDLFGTDQNYVVPVQSLNTKSDLLNAFLWLQQQESEIQTHLHKIKNEYASRALKAVEFLKQL